MCCQVCSLQRALAVAVSSAQNLHRLLLCTVREIKTRKFRHQNAQVSNEHLLADLFVTYGTASNSTRPIRGVSYVGFHSNNRPGCGKIRKPRLPLATQTSTWAMQCILHCEQSELSPYASLQGVLRNPRITSLDQPHVSRQAMFQLDPFAVHRNCTSRSTRKKHFRS